MSVSDRAIKAVILLEMENARLRRRLAEQDDSTLIRAFWSCGDSSVISYAVMRAHLNRNELTVLRMILDDCMTQERAAEAMDISTRSLQALWRSGIDKILHQPWVRAYAVDLARRDNGR